MPQPNMHKTENGSNFDVVITETCHRGNHSPYVPENTT